MKSYVLFTMVSLLVSGTAGAEIKNGYEKDIAGARESRKRLHQILASENSTPIPNIKLLRNQVSKVDEFITNYELTARLLAEFRTISPALFDEINLIKDRHGRPVDVYIKLINKAELPAPLKGTTNVEQAKGDKHAYYSEYGFNTVSVKVAIGKRSLWALAHEFGHIAYLVPNLASYMEDYINYYKKKNIHPSAMGHQPDDPSGRIAQRYEASFAVSYNTRLRGRAAPFGGRD